MKLKNKITNSIKRYDIVCLWINNCDSKSSFLLAFYGVLLSFIASSSLIDKIKKTLSLSINKKCIDGESIIKFVSLVCLLLFIFFTIRFFYFIYNTLKARINPNVFTQNNLMTNSNLFFQTISQNNYEDFENLINSENKTDFLSDLNSQIYINSKIATIKFNNYNTSISSTFLGLLFFMLYVYLS